MKMGKTVIEYTDGNGVRVVKCIIINENGKFVGLSKCNPTDEYIFEYGRTIAETRATMKSVKASARYFDSLADTYQRIADNHRRKALTRQFDLQDFEYNLEQFLKNI